MLHLSASVVIPPELASALVAGLTLNWCVSHFLQHPPEPSISRHQQQPQAQVQDHHQPSHTQQLQREYQMEGAAHSPQV